MDEAKLRDKFAGAILGTLVGDMLGAPVEGWDCERLNATLNDLPNKPRPERELAHAVFGLISGADVMEGTGRYTDDGQMTLALCESLVAFPKFDGPDMSRRFADHFEAYRGYGPGAYGVLMALRNGAVWDEPAQKLFGGQGSFGNGAAMRAAPVGLLYHRHAPRLRRVAEAQSVITHTHVLGIQGAVLQAAAVAIATQFDAETDDFDAVAFLEQVTQTAGILEPWYRDGMRDVQSMLANPPHICEASDLLVCGIEAHLSVPAALYAFLAHYDSFAEAVLYAVRLGGDTDTIGAMCGAIAGALHGAEAIPPNWLAALENGYRGRDYALILAEQLFDTWRKQDVFSPT